jgi:hypothetical protein
MIPKRKHLLIGLGLAHLTIISIFIWTHTVRNYPNSWGRWMSLYMNYAGSNRDYSFFAPSVANYLQAMCIVKDSSNVAQVYKITTSEHEANFRFDCMISACMRKQAGMDMFAQSWSAFYLSHHRHAASATIVSQTFNIPTLQAYEKGKRPFWETFYIGTFIPKSSQK